ncbi:unnamed protein product [Ambrosiozyma monospora]|uniref:Unnamed protein product n=1 Tax=Ambrosiozyma monospora TaxID=43982 RepID=A0A9W6WHX6_AMBMO|nr:unnamed protein product [Ambrosiozyma monospora]
MIQCNWPYEIRSILRNCNSKISIRSINTTSIRRQNNTNENEEQTIQRNIPTTPLDSLIHPEITVKSLKSSFQLQPIPKIPRSYKPTTAVPTRPKVMPITPNSVIFQIESKRQKDSIMELIEPLLDINALNEEISGLGQEKMLSVLHPRLKNKVKLDKLPDLPRPLNETNFNEYIIDLVSYNYTFGSQAVVELLDDVCLPLPVKMLTRESLLEITAFYYRCNYFSKPFILRSLILQERPDIAYDSEFYALELDYIRDCFLFA